MKSSTSALNIAKYYKRRKGQRNSLRNLRTVLPQVSELARDQLVQVILNLILNSMDATDEGNVRSQFATSREDGPIADDRNHADTGRGIAAERREPAFSNPTSPRNLPGTGLGLFVCRQNRPRTTERRSAVKLIRSDSSGTTFQLSCWSPAR